MLPRRWQERAARPVFRSSLPGAETTPDKMIVQNGDTIVASQPSAKSTASLCVGSEKLELDRRPELHQLTRTQISGVAHPQLRSERFVFPHGGDVM